MADYEEIIDKLPDAKHTRYPKPYLVGMGAGLLAIGQLLCFIGLSKATTLYSNSDDLHVLLLVAIPLLAMAYISIKGDRRYMYTNILQVGLVSYEVMVLLSFLAVVLIDMEPFKIGRTPNFLTIFLFTQLMLVPISAIAFVIWLVPGQLYQKLKQPNNLNP